MTEARSSSPAVFRHDGVTLDGRGALAEIKYPSPTTDARGRAVGDAVATTLDWAFGDGGFQTVTWRTAAGDIAGWRAAWQNGFTFDGTVRRSYACEGDLVDAWHATLLATDTRDPKTQWLEPVRIEHVGVVLRDVRESDEKRFLETINDPQSELWLGTIPMPRTPELFRGAMRRRLLQASLGKAINWSVADPTTDEYLAHVTLFGLDDLDYLSGEVGYRTHPDARGRGVLTSALRAVIAHAFTPVDQGGVGLDRLQLLAGDGNHASHGIARSCGFTEVGRDRQCYDLYDGRVVDLIRFDLLRSEFQST